MTIDIPIPDHLRHSGVKITGLLHERAKSSIYIGEYNGAGVIIKSIKNPRHHLLLETEKSWYQHFSKSNNALCAPSVLSWGKGFIVVESLDGGTFLGSHLGSNSYSLAAGMGHTLTEKVAEALQEVRRT